MRGRGLGSVVWGLAVQVKSEVELQILVTFIHVVRSVNRGLP